MTKYEIEIPDEMLVLDEKRFAPTGEYRVPMRGEWYFDGYLCNKCKWNLGGVFLIFREVPPPWTWPEGLFTDDVVAIEWNGVSRCWMVEFQDGYRGNFHGIKWTPPPEKKRYERPKK